MGYNYTIVVTTNIEKFFKSVSFTLIFHYAIYKIRPIYR